MAVEKLSISLPKGLAEQLDTLAEADGVTRSSLVREATARYVATRAADAESQRRRASIDAAVSGFDEAAALWGEDDRQSVEYLADIRDAGRSSDLRQGADDE